MGFEPTTFCMASGRPPSGPPAAKFPLSTVDYPSGHCAPKPVQWQWIPPDARG
jgi:hypothetical protein